MRGCVRIGDFYTCRARSALTSLRTFIYCSFAAVLACAAAFGQAPAPSGLRIALAARAQVGVTVRYDPAYSALGYPGGDVDPAAGVCTDVVIRALRAALGMDLQKLVHEDMAANFKKYPQKWGLRGPDSNIDHRRVPNLRTYFTRRGWGLPVSADPGDYLPGDLVTCIVPPQLPHIMIVSDRRGRKGRPLVIHNIGYGMKEEDRLFEFRLTGHYRLPAVGPPHS